jgi:enamine deaminase RidA (YjgF/YER057c/UK114 family)
LPAQPRDCRFNPLCGQHCDDYTPRTLRLEARLEPSAYLTDIDEQDQLNEVWWVYFGDHRPRTATIEVTRLVAHPKFKVEVAAVAMVEQTLGSLTG